jgi:hypothetical protein
MRKLLAYLLAISSAACTLDACANNNNLQGDLNIPGFNKNQLNAIANNAAQPAATNFTVLPYDYNAVVAASRISIQTLLQQLINITDRNQRVQQAGQYFMDRPYATSGAEGEGNWCDVAKRNCPHIQQDPIYRTDQLNCQTLVQAILGTINAKNLNQYEDNILKIEYGAAGESPYSIHYYNRNNFASGDFNPINQANGILTDVTNSMPFQDIVKSTSANITRQTWFEFQEKPEVIKNNVRVINQTDGEAMYQRFTNDYPAQFHNFQPENVSINYIPKENLTIKKVINNQITYVPNTALINKIPTPAVIEIVRDVKKWNIGGKNIKDVIGSELNVSHMGLAYRQDFKKGDTIYQKITCNKDVQAKKICSVAPVVCNDNQGCHEVMFLEATNAYPDGYYYYKDNTGNYHCTAEKPADNTSYTSCNRVIALPLGDYLTTYQYGNYNFMESPSIVGINVQKIN